jgi:hypothetical protein
MMSCERGCLGTVARVWPGDPATQVAQGPLMWEANGGTMDRQAFWLPILLSALLLGCGGKAGIDEYGGELFAFSAGVDKREGVGFYIDARRWKPIPAYSQEVAGRYRIDEWVRPGETVDGWTELFTVQNWVKSQTGGSPQEFMKQLEARHRKDCPEVSWSLLDQGDDEVLYEWSHRGCNAFPEQYEIARILDGKWNRWRIAFTKKGAAPSEEIKRHWRRRLLAAAVRQPARQ